MRLRSLELGEFEIAHDVGDRSVLYHSQPGLRARNRFVGRWPKMVTIRPSEWPLRNALNGIPRAWRVSQD
jgi:hypothetical protein